MRACGEDEVWVDESRRHLLDCERGNRVERLDAVGGVPEWTLGWLARALALWHRENARRLRDRPLRHFSAAIRGSRPTWSMKRSTSARAAGRAALPRRWWVGLLLGRGEGFCFDRSTATARNRGARATPQWQVRAAREFEVQHDDGVRRRSANFERVVSAQSSPLMIQPSGWISSRWSWGPSFPRTRSDTREPEPPIELHHEGRGHRRRDRQRQETIERRHGGEDRGISAVAQRQPPHCQIMRTSVRSSSDQISLRRTQMLQAPPDTAVMPWAALWGQ